MPPTTRLLAGAILGIGLVLAAGSAQLSRPRPAVNPYTGTAATAPVANPLTGKSAATNPLTGRAAAPATGYNPLTGKGQPPGSPPPGHGAWPTTDPPVRGKAGKGLEAIDKAVLQIMDRHGIPGAGLAVARHGKLIYARGFGWADLPHQTAVEPQTPFGLASLSKPLTALATLLLVERGKLSLDDRALDHLKHIKPIPGIPVDPRLRKVTIRQLLNHTGGWDRSVSGDPVTWSPQIARTLRVRLPVSNEQFIMFMLGVRLDFEPGTKYMYSNVGYMLLDDIIEKVSGQRYEEFVRKNVLEPAGAEKIFLSTTRQDYREGEARGYLAGTANQVPPMALPMARAAAGWCASPIDMVRLLTALDGSRTKKLLQDKTFDAMVAAPPAPLQKNKDGTYPGLGWPTAGPSGKGYGYLHDGNWPGTRAFMKCNAARGLNWALLFNVSMQPDPVDQGIVSQARQDLQELLEKTEGFPDLDLFAEFK